MLVYIFTFHTISVRTVANSVHGKDIWGCSDMISSLKGGLSQNMTIDDKLGGGVHQKMTDKDEGTNKKLKHKKNHP